MWHKSLPLSAAVVFLASCESVQYRPQSPWPDDKAKFAKMDIGGVASVVNPAPTQAASAATPEVEQTTPTAEQVAATEKRLAETIVPVVQTIAPVETLTATMAVPARVQSRAPSSLPTALNRIIHTDPTQPTQKPPEYNLACKEFFDLLAQTQPATVEEALAHIQKIRPKFLTQTTYAYQSLSNDDATFMYPRTFVFGGDAKLVLAFNGHKKQNGYERLEAMCFDDQENKFDFTDIAFPQEANTPEAIADLTEEEKAKKFVVIPGGRNQRDCKRCHETPSRPNWDTFAVWPGMYGGIDDSLKDQARADQRPTYSTLEFMKWNQFQSKTAKQGRYKYTTQEMERPNAEFTVLLGYLNGKRIVGDLKRQGDMFKPFKYDFAKALFCAPKAERRFFRQYNVSSSEGATFAVLDESANSETRETFLSSYFDQMGKERRLLGILKDNGLAQPFPKEKFEEMRHYYRRMFKEENLDLRISTVDIDEILLIRELEKVTDKVGVDIENWSMVLHGGIVHETGLGGDGKTALRLILERPYLEQFLKDDAELYQMFTEKQEHVKVCGMITRRQANPPAEHP